MQINEITEAIIRAAIKVHKALGPGLLEQPYKLCTAHQLTLDGFQVELEKPLPVIYQGLKIDRAYRIDMLVEDCVIVEVKASEKLHPLFEAQLLTYLRLTNNPVGLLMNFNEKTLVAGLRRIVNNYDEVSALSASSALKK